MPGVVCNVGITPALCMGVMFTMDRVPGLLLILEVMSVSRVCGSTGSMSYTRYVFVFQCHTVHIASHVQGVQHIL